jgi:5-methyltetrahydropteroyltriglutamate--homocysteine methyltransferase
MTPRTDPPFRADHVGSLLRPAELLHARSAFTTAEIEAEELREAQAAAIRDVIGLQRDVGLRSVTDGEFTRSSWHMDFIARLGGVELARDELVTVRFRGEQGVADLARPAKKITGRVTLPETIFGDAFAFLRDNASEDQTPKMTIPSPSMVHYGGGDAAIDPAVYPDVDEFWADLANAYNAQMRGLYDLGCRYLQLDDVSLATINDPVQRNHVEELGGDADHLHERYIANINRALRGRPADLTVTTHLCRGNYQSMWSAEGGYDFVAEALFNELDVDGYFLEYDDERSGDFAPLRFVPKGKIVVLGLITTKRAPLEDKDMLKRRIEDAARYVDVDQLCLSPQCGFSSAEVGNALTIDDQTAKLRLAVEVADEVWG